MAISRNSLVSRLHLHFMFSFFSSTDTGKTIYQILGSKWKHDLQESRSSSICSTRLETLCSGQAISITYYVCVCSRSYPACKSHAPCYSVICPLSGRIGIFPRLINLTIFEKKIIKCVLILSTSFV
jgi:hypothetical protein